MEELESGWDIELPVMENNDVNLSDFRRSTALVLAGGGMKGCYLLGALQYLYDHNGLENIRSFYGTSIGGVLSALLIIGYKPIEIFVYICTNKVQEALGQFNQNILERKCLLDPTAMIKFLTNMILEKLGKIPTLGELKEMFQKDLCVVTIARDRVNEPLYLSTRTHADMSLVQALHMSISIPFVFGYAVYQNRKYIDGGLIDNFPIQHASENELRVFGLDLKNPDTDSESTDFTSEFMSIATAPVSYITNYHKKHLGDNATYLDIITSSEIGINFNQTSLAMYKMFVYGFRQCKERMSVKCKKD